MQPLGISHFHKSPKFVTVFNVTNPVQALQIPSSLCLGSQSGNFRKGFPTESLYECLFYPKITPSPVTSATIFGEEYKLWCCSLRVKCSTHCCFYSPLCPNILPSTQFSNTKLTSSVNTRNMTECTKRKTCFFSVLEITSTWNNTHLWRSITYFSTKYL
jgi:hypothetical protein